MSRTYYRTNPETGEVERSSTPFHEGASRVPVFTDLYMDGVATADGMDIGSRAKRRAYMKATGAADASDYTNHVSRGAAERLKLRTGEHDSKAIARAVDMAWERNR